METPLTYEEAYAELQEIVTALESDSISVDELGKQVKRAAELVAYCQAKLKSAEGDVTNILRQLD